MKKQIRLLLIRAECTNKNLGILLSETRRFYHRRLGMQIINQSKDFMVQEYIIPVSPTDDFIYQAYRRIIEEKVSPQFYFERIKTEYNPSEEYYTYVIFDLIFAENAEANNFEYMQDTISIQYLMLTLNRLLASSIHFKVFLSGANGSLETPHSPLDYSKTITKIRTFLLLCSQKGTAYSEYAALIDHIRALYKYNAKDGKHSWRMLFADSKTATFEQQEIDPIGRIVPFIPINEETYLAFQNVNDDLHNSSVKLLTDIFGFYLERYVKLLSVYKELEAFYTNKKTYRERRHIDNLWVLNQKEIDFLEESRNRLEADVTQTIELAIDNGSIYVQKEASFADKIKLLMWSTFILRILDVDSSISGRHLRTILIKQQKGFNKQENSMHNLADDCMRIINSLEKDGADKFLSIKNKLKPAMRWRDEMTSDTLLEKLLFMVTLYYYTDDKKKEGFSFSDDSIALLHEICIDYAQGVFQLIENAWFHVIRPDQITDNRNKRGCGGLTIRIRKKEDMKCFLDEEKIAKSDESERVFKGVQYFLEIYVTDLQYDLDDFRSVARVFHDNVYNQATHKNNAGYKAAKQLCEGGAVEEIGLTHLFGAEKYEPLENYLKDPANIVFHYGLQILSNVIETGEGSFMVRSGNGEKDTFSSNNVYYKRQSFSWQNGTAYMILLPVNMEKRINYQDALAVNNDYKNQRTDDRVFTTIKAIRLDLGNSAGQKNKAVNEMKDSFGRIIHGQESQSIFVIDCSEYRNGLDYEVLAKSVFLCAASEREKEPTFALINVKNRHEVIKLFRQFALFYNREGENNNITKNNAIFIVDKNAEIDILLYGSINSIIENMYQSQIYGGIDSRAMKIIAHLGNRGKR